MYQLYICYSKYCITIVNMFSFSEYKLLLLFNIKNIYIFLVNTKYEDNCNYIKIFYNVVKGKIFILLNNRSFFFNIKIIEGIISALIV